MAAPAASPVPTAATAAAAPVAGEAKSSAYAVPFLPVHPFRDELIATARRIASPGKGILAADESTGTIGSRFKEIKVENNRANRREFRRMLFTTPGLAEYISGVITYEETLFDKTEDGKTDLVEYLKQQNILIGIKVDMGTKVIPGTDKETYTQGLTDLDVRCKKYYAQGARFAKWRAVLEIAPAKPSPCAILENAMGLARYAAVCQQNGLVPIVEPEVLMDGSHSIEICQYWTEKVLAATYKALSDYNVLLEGTLLKPNMVVSGKKCPTPATAAQIARATVTALQRNLPAAVPGVTFLSGGQSEEEATVNLNAMNSLDLGVRPWSLTFSYGRALQQSCLKAWRGEDANVPAAQAVLLARARANGQAAQGLYSGGAGGEGANASTFVKGYVY